MHENTAKASLQPHPVSESLLPFKMQLKKLFLQLQEAFLSKGKWGIKCLKYCFQHRVSVYLRGDVKKRSAVKTQLKVKNMAALFKGSDSSVKAALCVPA